jgi:Ser/Thr protein kinase RdoA (MazF antagonist)
MLPETPSVDFLRQEAKDLLVAMRETKADATLSRAQRALAERYGFTSWTELTGEVKRRRASGAKLAPELGAAIAAAFDLGKPAGPLAHLSWSQIGARWALDTDSGRFMPRTILDYITEESLEESLRLREAAIADGVRAPKAVRSKNGKLVEELAGKKWCVDGWIDVGPTPNLPVAADIASNVGATLAKLHNLALPTTGEITAWLTARRDEKQWNAILDAVRSSGAEWAPMLESTLPDILDLTSICVDAPRDDKILCINDYGPGSVRLAKDDEIAIVHWDFAGANTPSWEVGAMLDGWALSHDGSVNDVAVGALIDGYRREANAMPELDLTVFSPAICGYLNWMNGRISRALDDEDPERQRLEVLELRHLLKYPRTRATYERILEVATA